MSRNHAAIEVAAEIRIRLTPPSTKKTSLYPINGIAGVTKAEGADDLAHTTTCDTHSQIALWRLKSPFTGLRLSDRTHQINLPLAAYGPSTDDSTIG